MNSKQMIKWAGFYLLLASIGVAVALFTGDDLPLATSLFLVVSVIYAVGSSIMKKLEAMNNGNT